MQKALRIGPISDGLQVLLGIGLLVIIPLAFSLMGASRLAEEDASSPYAEAEAQHVRQTSAKPDDIPVLLEEATAANEEICAWLYIPKTNVSLPVARHEGDDNSYYLMHAADKSESILGCAYMEQANSPNFDNPVTVLYAHSFHDANVMFTDLQRLTYQEDFEACEKFFVYLPGRMLEYKIISACIYSDTHILDAIDFDDDGALENFFLFATHCDPRSSISRAVRDLDAKTDRLVMLSTCTVPTIHDARLVISGYLLEERETDS